MKLCRELKPTNGISVFGPNGCAHAKSHMQMGNYMEITAAVYTTLEKVQLAAIIAYSTLILFIISIA